MIALLSHCLLRMPDRRKNIGCEEYICMINRKFMHSLQEDNSIIYNVYI